MAKISDFGFVELDQMLGNLRSIPTSTKNRMLKAAAKEFKEHTEKSAKRMIVPGSAKNRKGTYSTGYTRDNVIIKKDGNDMLVTWGNEIRHRKGVRANEVAFLTEYGVPGRKIPARPFIAQAVKEGSDDAYEAAMNVLDEFLNNL